MPLTIPNLSTLYSILKRNIERDNDVLAQRKGLANELRDNAETWTALLIETFGQAIALWESDGKQAAIAAVEELINDFSALDYYSLQDTSPILKFLGEDGRFDEFVYACRQYYQSALDVKRLVHSGIENGIGEYVSMHDTDIGDIVKLYNAELELMQRRLAEAHNQTKTITPK